MSSSSFLTDLTIALGAQIGDHDLQLLTTSCPHLEHLTLAFQHVSDEGQLSQLQTPCSHVQPVTSPSPLTMASSHQP